MELNDLTYKIYRASTGRSSFWRWDVYKKRLKAPIRSGFVYGNMADAKQHASAVMTALARPAAQPKLKPVPRQ
jgi:D-alanyl-D-alanine carboxypeptidase